MKDNPVSKNPKITIAVVSGGIESFGFLIKDDTIKKIYTIISPAIALLLTIIFKNFHRYFEAKRGIKVYTDLIIELQKELNDPNISNQRKTYIQEEINRCRDLLYKIKTDSIKILID